MLDIKFLRENPEIVKQNIRNKFQDQKLGLVDEVIELDAQKRAAQQEADNLRAERNKLSKQIGALMGQGKKEEAEEVKKQVAAEADRLAELSEKEKELDEKILKDMNSRGGGYPFTDKADAETIKRETGLSRNAFKRAVGRLLKAGKIEITPDGIRAK